MENTGQIWIAVVQWDSVIPAQGWWATSRAAHGCWSTPQCSLIPTNSLGHREGHGPYTVFKNSHRALEWQTAAKLSSWLFSSSSMPWKSLLPPQVLSISQFLLRGPQGCHFYHLHCQPSVSVDPAEKPARVWAGSTHNPVDTLPPPWAPSPTLCQPTPGAVCAFSQVAACCCRNALEIHFQRASQLSVKSPHGIMLADYLDCLACTLSKTLSLNPFCSIVFQMLLFHTKTRRYYCSKLLYVINPDEPTFAVIL